MKSIQQGLYFPWFLKRATTSGKNIIKKKIGIAIKFYKCYVIKRCPSNFLNKTQLKYIYIYIYLFINGFKFKYCRFNYYYYVMK